MDRLSSSRFMMLAIVVQCMLPSSSEVSDLSSHEELDKSLKCQEVVTYQ